MNFTISIIGSQREKFSVTEGYIPSIIFGMFSVAGSGFIVQWAAMIVTKLEILTINL